MIKTHSQKTVPIGKEKDFLANAEKARHKREQGQTMLILSGKINSRCVQHFDEIL